MHPTSKQRTTHFVDRSVQGALARRVLVHWILFLVTSVVSVTIMQILLGDPNRSVLDHVSAAASRYALFSIVLLALLPAFILDTVRLSNRFAGPICRLRTAFRQVAQGEPHEPLKFRGKDFWKDVADDYNAMMERLTADHPKAKRASEETTHELTDCQKEDCHHENCGKESCASCEKATC